MAECEPCASTSTCRSSPARRASSRRCAARTPRALSALVERLRDAVPDLALGTDIIVGFPGETEEDFAETLAVVEEVRFDSAFTFIYQPAPRNGGGRRCPTRCPRTSSTTASSGSIEIVQRIAAERNAERVGRVEEVLVEGPSRTDAALLRGRTRRNTTVNFAGRGARRETSSRSAIEGATSTTLRAHGSCARRRSPEAGR